MKDTCSVCIIGAGIGGVAAAIAIARAGHRVTILEQAKELTEVWLIPSIQAYMTSDDSDMLISKPDRCRDPSPNQQHSYSQGMGPSLPN